MTRRARWGQVLPRLGRRRALLRRGRPLPGRRLLPRRRHRPGERYVATLPGAGGTRGRRSSGRGDAGRPAYERWVAGYDVETGPPKGRLRDDERGSAVRRGRGQRPEDLVTGRGAAPGDRRRLRRRPGQGRGRDHRLAGRARHHPGRAAWPAGAGPGREARGGGGAALHLPRRRPAPPSPPADQRPRLRRRRVARAALGRRRGQHRGDQRDRARRGDVRPRVPGALAAHGYTLDPETGEVAQLAPYAGGFSARAAQITRNIDRYEAQWRSEHPARSPGRAAAGLGPSGVGAGPTRQGRAPKTAPSSAPRGASELHELGFTPRPSSGVEPSRVPIGRVNRDAVADLVLSRLGARGRAGTPPTSAARSSGSSPPSTSWRRARCATSWSRTSPTAPRHGACRCWPATTYPSTSAASPPSGCSTSRPTWSTRLAARAEQPGDRRPVGTVVARRTARPRPTRGRRRTGRHRPLLVIEGAAGAGKTTTLAAARELLDDAGPRLVVVTPTLKAAQVAAGTGRRRRVLRRLAGPPARLPLGRGRPLVPQTAPHPRPAHGCCPATSCSSTRPACSTRTSPARCSPSPMRPRPGRVRRRPPPAPGRRPRRRARPRRPLGAPRGVPRAGDRAPVHRPRVRRPDPADAHRERAGEVFDELLARGLIVIHPTEVERLAALATDRADGHRRRLVIADTREQVAALNAAIRDQRLRHRADERPVSLP